MLFAFIESPDSQVKWNSDNEYPDRDGWADLMVGPNSASLFSQSIMFPQVEVVVEDLQRQFDENAEAEKRYPYLGYNHPTHVAARRQGTDPFWNAYRDYGIMCFFGVVFAAAMAKI